MTYSSPEDNHRLERRQRIHELLIALIKQQDSLDLMDNEMPVSEGTKNSYLDREPAAWLDRNRRVLHRYQALVRSAVTLDALLDAEQESIR